MAAELNEVYRLVEGLSVDDRLLLIEHIVEGLRDQSVAGETPANGEIEPFSDEEIQAMLTPNPMTGREIIEAGLAGGWSDLGIEDGAEWVREQRARRNARLQWSSDL